MQRFLFAPNDATLLPLLFDFSQPKDIRPCIMHMGPLGLGKRLLKGLADFLRTILHSPRFLEVCGVFSILVSLTPPCISDASLCPPTMVICPLVTTSLLALALSSRARC